MPDRLAAAGVPDGPERKDLAEGRPIVLADCRTVNPEQVLGPLERGTKLVVVGDAETIEGLQDHVRDSDLLVIEATFLSAMARRRWITVTSQLPRQPNSRLTLA